jgi:hypothetical protein
VNGSSSTSAGTFVTAAGERRSLLNGPLGVPAAGQTQKYGAPLLGYRGPMQRRALLSLVNIAVAAGALLVFFLYPRYAGYAIYVFLGWFVVSFATVWIARGGSPVPGTSRGMAVPTPAGVPPSPAPMVRPGVPAAAPAPPVSFCIYCAADLPVGTDRCPTCGHAGARLT